MSSKKTKKNLIFGFQRKNKMALKLCEFLEEFVIDTFLRKLAQFEKTGSLGKISISLEI